MRNAFALTKGRKMKFKSIEELLKFAIKKEIASAQFYTDLAATTQNEIIKDLFLVMAKEEINHKRQLELEVMKLGIVVTEEDPNMRHQPDAFLLESDIDKTFGFAETLQLAIQKEHASFGMYMDLYAITEDDEQRLVIMEMAEEEVRHKVILESQYNELLK
jgi:rubrerythrin